MAVVELWTTVLFVCGATVAQGWLFPKAVRKICYEPFGCFSSKYPYTNTPGLLPRSPEYVGTKFLLFTRNGTTGGDQELIVHGKAKKNTWETFGAERPTVVIIHGYLDSVERKWVQDMVAELLDYDDMNVIVTDWRRGAREVNYYQSAANIRLVGAQVAWLVKHLGLVYRIDPKTLHIIGHSLGAHAAGYAGESVDGIGRITGLDPAGPAFEGQDERVRLDPSDAAFVDVIHTDAERLMDLGFGLEEAVGTVDFYPNGGKNQPGCASTYFQQMKLLFTGHFELVKIFACNHLRALRYFTESINSNCSFPAYPCQTISSRSSKLCRKCDGACAVMGFHTNIKTAPGIYFVETNSTSPFCLQN